jgi:hypothetical protein
MLTGVGAVAVAGGAAISMLGRWIDFASAEARLPMVIPLNKGIHS